MCGAKGFAWRNASVAEEAWVYRDLERLAAFGLIDKVISGNKPWSQSEVARLIEEARGNLGRLHDAEVEVEARRTLKDLEHEFGSAVEEKKVRLFREIRADYLFLDSPDREIPQQVGTGDAIEAFVNPLIRGQRGARIADSQNFRLLTHHDLNVSKNFTVTGSPYFLFRQNDLANEYARVGFNELYARFESRNVGLQAGRDVLAWGSGGASAGGVFHSLNATPLDMAKFSNIHPFRYPWIFRYLGPSQASFFFSLLEGQRDFSHPYIAGWKLSFQPHRRFEFGFTHEVMSGGDGSRGASFGRRAADTFGIFTALANNDPNISNRVGGFDVAWRLPGLPGPLSGAKIYYEALMEDTQSPSHFDIMFIDEAIHQAGIFLPRLNPRGTQTLRFEVTRSGFRPYRHHQYTSGWTRNRRLIGHPLGPDAVGFLAEFESSPTYYFHQSHSFAVESYDSDRYQLLNNATDVRKTADNPSETRLRWMSGFDWLPSRRQKFSLGLGLERVRQFNFIPGRNANNFLVNLGWTVFPKI